ncbi:MAG: hypothetical protein LC637_03580 [Xanthomonadaceae bacterium]|nr:hypothetical protein [Xanthomonadaceae bacterium]
MMIRNIRVALAILMGAAVLALLSMPVAAESTDVRIQVRAVDAKFIGSGVGGMNVVVENAQTGALLASGKITGTTGDTEALMKQGQIRGHAPATPDSASFTASIDIDRPVLARIRVAGPLDGAHSIRQLSVTQWLLPGQDLVDPGVVLQLPGLIVAPIEVAVTDDQLRIGVDVSMLCGCPITRGGLWDSEDFSVNASLYREGEKVQTFPLQFTGKTNRFAAKVAVPETGSYELWILAHESNADNTGAWHQRLEF